MEFEVLIDLAKTITRNKIKNIEVLGNSRGKKNRVELLYDGIISDKFKSERDVVRHLFNSYDTRNPSYLKLKNKLIHQLINSSFFVDVNQPSYNERAKAYYAAHKDFAAATILMSRNSEKSGLYIFQLVLEQAIKYEFIGLAADAARMLRWNYARSSSDYEKNSQYTDIHRKYEKIRYYENLVMEEYETLIRYYTVKRSPNKEIHNYATICFNRFFPMLEKVNTSSFHFYVYSIGIIKYWSANDIENTLKLCDDVLYILESRKNTNRSTLVSIKIQKMACYVHLRINDHKTIQDLLIYCLSVHEEGDFNWFRVYEVYFYYCIYFSRYNEAVEVYSKVIKSITFNLLDGSFHDNWLLLGGYLHLLANLGVLASNKVEEVVGPFRYSKFFNE
ncbi:MAG: hypothetical protein IT262_07745, partial [Saprospiraceae bacterium]|nr:hypothetical protein [Saprospiraceae bacterium]